MTELAELFVSLRLSADRFMTDVRQAGRGLNDLRDQVGSLGRGMATAGATLTAGLTLPIVGLGTAAIKASADWEQAMTELAKTVDAPVAEIAALGREFRRLSETMPTSANELARIGAAAGQLGIKTENIVRFTKVMADLGSATNLSAEEAANGLARLANITGMSQTEFDRLGSTIVDLGNNMATTEREIVEMSLRLAGAGTQVGLSEAEILSFAAALSSVGVEAEAGGTAISRVFATIASAAADGGVELERFAAVAGMSAQDYKRAFQEDAAGATLAFIEGLKRTSDEGKNVFAVLEELELGDIRVRDALLRAAGASDLFSDALRIGSTAWQENTALTAEAERFYATLSNRLAAFGNAVLNVATELGESLRPMLEQVFEVMRSGLDIVRGLVEQFASLDPRFQAMIVGFLGVLAAIGPVLVVLGGLTIALAALLSPIGLVVSAIAIVVGAVAGVVAAFVAWVSQNEEAKKALMEAWAEVQAAVEELRKEIEPIIADLSALWKEYGDEVMAVVKTTFTQAIAIITGLIRTLANTISFVLNIIEGDWRGAWQDIRDIVDAIKDTIVRIVGSLWTLIEARFTEGIRAVTRQVEAFRDGVIAPFQRLKDVVVGHSIVPEMWDEIKEAFETGVADAIAEVGRMGDEMRGKFETLFTDLTAKVKGWITEGGPFREQIQKLGELFKVDLAGWVQEGIDKLAGKLTDFFVAKLRGWAAKGGDFWNAVKALGDLFEVDWIAAIGRAVNEAIRLLGGLLQWIARRAPGGGQIGGIPGAPGGGAGGGFGSGGGGNPFFGGAPAFSMADFSPFTRTLAPLPSMAAVGVGGGGAIGPFYIDNHIDGEYAGRTIFDRGVRTARRGGAGLLP